MNGEVALTLFWLVLVLGALPAVIVARLAPRRGCPRLGFALLGWLGVIILLCMNRRPEDLPATDQPAPKRYTAADYRKAAFRTEARPQAEPR